MAKKINEKNLLLTIITFSLGGMVWTLIVLSQDLILTLDQLSRAPQSAIERNPSSQTLSQPEIYLDCDLEKLPVRIVTKTQGIMLKWKSCQPEFKSISEKKQNYEATLFYGQKGLITDLIPLQEGENLIEMTRAKPQKTQEILVINQLENED
jgi:hypothetical protein